MKLTQITVSFGVTQSLPEYSNVKPNLTLTATIEDGDDPAAVEAELWQLAKAHVHEEVDRALEANDRPAKYSSEVRYQVLYTYWNQWDHRGEEKPPQYVVIAPDEAKIGRETYAQQLLKETSKVRLPHARRAAAQLIADKDEQRELIDCSDGDLSRLEAAIGKAPESNPEVAQEPDHPF